jgi:hypothetical protein
MWEGMRELHSGHDLNFGARQRLAERRSFCLDLETRRFGTAMVVLG